MKTAAAIIYLVMGGSALAETVVPSQTLRAHTIIAPHDLVVRAFGTPGAISDPEEIIGLETRVTLYAGRPIPPSSIGPPALVTRNQLVVLRYAAGELNILVDGRSLGRGGEGDRVRVMNLSSRSTLFGTVQPDGTIEVSQ